MTQINVTLAKVEVSGKIVEKAGDRAWTGDALEYKVQVDWSNMTEDKLLELAQANWKVRFHAWLKPKGEQAVRDWFANATQPIDAMECLSEGGGGFVGKFAKCQAAIEALRLAKFTDFKIINTLEDTYGVDNVRAVLAGNNPWKVAAKPKAEPAGKVLQLDAGQKSEVIKVAKQVREAMAAETVEAQLNEVVKLCGFNEKLSGIVRTYAGQIIK